MKKIIEGFKRVILDKNLYIFLVIAVIFFGGFCLLQYAPDTYDVFVSKVKDTVLHFFSCGRYITGLAAAFAMKFLNLTNFETYCLSFIFALLCTIISLYRLNNLIRKEINNNILSILISTIIIINPFSIELYMYIEKGIMMLSVLLSILAVEQIVKFFEGNKKSIVWALILMFLANCCYQGTTGLFVSISLIYIIKYSKSIKEFVKNNVIAALTYGIPMLLNLLLMKITTTNVRISGDIVFKESMVKILNGLENMIIDTYQILPSFVFLFSITIIVIIIIYKIIRSKEKYGQKLINFLYLFYIVFVIILVSIAPQIIQNTNSIWFVARSSYPTATIMGVLLLYLFVRFNINSKIEKLTVAITVLMLLILQFIAFQQFIVSNHIVNYMDKQITLEINKEIQKYEEQTGNIVDTITLYNDKLPSYSYKDLKVSGDMNIKAYFSDWTIIPILKLYTQRDLNFGEKNIEIERKFAETDWDSFSKEQIIFDGNVMHLCKF